MQWILGRNTVKIAEVSLALRPSCSCSLPALTRVLQVDASELTGNSPRVDVVEIMKGVSPLEGTVSLSYREGFTADLAFDASSDEARHICRSGAGCVVLNRLSVALSPFCGLYYSRLQLQCNVAQYLH